MNKLDLNNEQISEIIGGALSLMVEAAHNTNTHFSDSEKVLVESTLLCVLKQLTDNKKVILANHLTIKAILLVL